MILSDTQIAMVANRAGFTGSNLTIAVAVSLAESGGDSNAKNTANTNGTTDLGLFQINTVHADLLRTGSWDNPQDNARMAHAVFASSGWHAWSTYNNGRYLFFMPRARIATANLAKSGTGTDVAFVNATDNYPVVLSGPGGTGKWPVPPYPVTPVPPYFQTQRKLMATWIANVYWNGTIPGILDPAIVKEYLDGKHDKQLHDDYKMHLEEKAAGDRPGGGAANMPKEPSILPPNPLDALIAIVKFISNPHNWLRLAYWIVGAALVLFAAYKMSGANLPSVADVAKVAAV